MLPELTAGAVLRVAATELIHQLCVAGSFLLWGSSSRKEEEVGQTCPACPACPSLDCGTSSLVKLAYVVLSFALGLGGCVGFAGGVAVVRRWPHLFNVGHAASVASGAQSQQAQQVT